MIIARKFQSSIIHIRKKFPEMPHLGKTKTRRKAKPKIPEKNPTRKPFLALAFETFPAVKPTRNGPRMINFFS